MAENYHVKELPTEEEGLEESYSFEFSGTTYIYRHEADINPDVSAGEEGEYSDETLILKDGAQVWSFEGYVPIEDAIEEFINSL